ncbi:MAG: hypothetical protein ACOCTN_05710 [Candidatus Natronoplasma sp.]
MKLDDIEEDRKKNLEERLRFIEEYARWVKRTPNEVWSEQQKEMIDSVLKSADEIEKEGVELS